MPTDCYEPTPPKVIESVCMTTGGESMDIIPMPDNALVVNNQDFGDNTIDLTVNQQWIPDEAGLAIEAGMNSCIIKGNVTFGDSENIEGQCYDGLASVTIVVYLDEEFDPNECEACNTNDLAELGGDYKFCAYRVEIPCESVPVECGEPSAEPSGSFYPSSAPSESPTESAKPSSSPTSSPSESPSKNPTKQPTLAPTNAPTESPSASPSGSFYPSSAPSDAPIISMYPSSSPTNVPTKVPTQSPTKSPTVSTTQEPTKEPTPAPTNMPSLSPTKAPTSQPSSTSTESMYPSSSPTNNNAATEKPFETLPPTVSTDAPTPCPPSLPILIENQGNTMYPDLPVIITQQNTTHVGFKVENTFASTVSSIFTEYHSGTFGETECLEEENVEQNSQVEIEFLATCMHHTHISVINVWVTDCDDELPPFLVPADNAQVPECCHPSEKQCKTVQYTFKLPCISPCPDDDDSDDISVMPIPNVPINKPLPLPEIPITKPHVGHASSNHNYNNIGTEGGLRHKHRNLATAATDIAKKKNSSNSEGSTEEFEAITAEHHNNEPDDEDHFCVVEDYPCGPNNDKVNVCHYSSRDGYKTFCVPEVDSDALRFYPKDYCGPCVGFGNSETA